MTPRRSQRAKRARDRAEKHRADGLAWVPGPRSECEAVEFSYPDSESPLVITIRTWSKDSMVQDLEIDAVLPGVMPVRIASLDCKNHGTIHVHDEHSDPEHSSRIDLIQLRSEADLVTYHERALREFLEYARRRLRAGGRP